MKVPLFIYAKYRPCAAFLKKKFTKLQLKDRFTLECCAGKVSSMHVCFLHHIWTYCPCNLHAGASVLLSAPQMQCVCGHQIEWYCMQFGQCVSSVSTNFCVVGYILQSIQMNGPSKCTTQESHGNMQVRICPFQYDPGVTRIDFPIGKFPLSSWYCYNSTFWVSVPICQRFQSFHIPFKLKKCFGCTYCTPRKQQNDGGSIF